MLENTMIFSLTANPDLTQSITKILKLDPGKVDIRHFADGEILVHTLSSVRGKKVFVIQSTCTPVTERLMELLIFVDSLKRSSAEEINIITPYFGYARQDRKAHPREPITAKLVADLLQIAGADRVVTIDLHAPQIQGFFNCPMDDLSIVPMMTKYLRENCQLENAIVVSPDHGGVTRARRLASTLNTPLAIIDKRRPAPNVAEVMNIIGEVEGKTVILVDDILDTGGTIVAASEALKKAGAVRILVVCSHLVLSGNASERIINSPIEKVIGSDTIPLPKEKKHNKFVVLSVDSMLAKTIEHIVLGKPLSEVYGVYNATLINPH